MSEDSTQNPESVRNERRIGHHGRGQSGKAGMMIAGAAALALLLGGGYYVYKNSSPTQVAAIDNGETFSETPTYTVVPGSDASTEKAGPLALGDDSPTFADEGAAAKSAPKKKIAAAEPAEATIGVSRVASNETATVSQSDDVVVSARRPVWRYAPRAERLAEYYPAAALDRGREGEASLHCMIGEKGKLDCERVSEFPAKAGFGNAALRVASTLRHADRRADGSNAIGTPINLRVMFRMAEGERRRG